MATRAERFLGHLERLSGGAEPRFLAIPSSRDELKGITVVAYRDLPPGLLTVITYGLSLGQHPDWRHGRPELCLSVRSFDERWGWAAGELVEGMRGTCPFTYGDTIDYGEPIAPDTMMSSFVVFAPAVLDRDDSALDVSVDPDAAEDRIHLQGLYPIHDVEREFIVERGLEAFWRRDWDMYDVGRPPAD